MVEEFYDMNEDVGQVTLSYQPQFLAWRLSIDEVLEDVELFLKGKRRRPDGSIESIGDPLMTDEGIYRLRLLLENLGKNLFLSNFTKEDINKIMRSIRLTVIKFIARNYDKYQIKREDWDIILTTIETLFFTALKRAYLEGERKSLATQILLKGYVKGEEEKKEEKKIFKLFG